MISYFSFIHRTDPLPTHLWNITTLPTTKGVTQDSMLYRMRYSTPKHGSCHGVSQQIQAFCINHGHDERLDLSNYIQTESAFQCEESGSINRPKDKVLC